MRAPIPRARTPSAGGTPMAAAASSTRSATRSPTGSSRPTGRRARPMTQPFACRRAAASTAASRRFTFDGRDLQRPARRHAGLGAARQRRPPGGPLVQVPPAARRRSPPGRRSRMRWSTIDRGGGAPHAQPARDPGRALRRPGRAQPEPLAVARASTSARVNDLLSPLLPAGFYYKTFMWPRGAWDAALRAADPPRRRARPRARTSRTRTATPAATPIATCWSSAPARPASPPRSAAAAAGARVILCDEQRRIRRLAARRARAPRSTAGRPRTGSPRASARLHAMPNVTLLPRTTAFGYYPGQPDRPRPSASPTTSPRPDPALPRERLWQVRAKRGRARHRRDRTAAGVPRQRPARRHAGRRRAHLPQPLRRPPGKPRRGRHRHDSAYRAAARPAARRRRDRR